MKIKVAEAEGAVLDYLVAVCEGLNPVMRHDLMRTKAEANNVEPERLHWHPEMNQNDPVYEDLTDTVYGLSPGILKIKRVPAYSTDWSQGGPIIERERLDVWAWSDAWTSGDNAGLDIRARGPTPLIAAMRCCVASKLGDEVEVPDELVL